MNPKHLHPETLSAQAMGWVDERTRAITPPIHVSSTYLRDPDNQYRSGRIYARADNPTFDQAETTLAALEGGAKALIFSSGMSAATACFLALSPGDHVVVPKVMYWSLRNWLASFATHWGLKVDFIDTDRTDAIAAAVARDPQVEECRTKAREAGFDMRVTLEAVVGFVNRNGGSTVTKITTPPRSLPSKPGFDLSLNDRRFLRSLRIGCDQPSKEPVDNS